MFADISHGHTDGADVLFLVAVVVFVIAFVLRVMTKPIPLDMVLVAAGFACLALAWLVL